MVARVSWALFLVVLSACAGPMVSAQDKNRVLGEEKIVEFSKEGQDSAEIIWRIGEAKAVYCLYIKDIARLQAAGVSNEVIDYMLDTRFWASVGLDGRPLQYRKGGYYTPPILNRGGGRAASQFPAPPDDW
ncbi:MAG: hypothetical protein V2A77_02325 [Pseudomonadota bacterium]